MILYVGDIHGGPAGLAWLDEWAVRHSYDWIIQVGDLAVFWPGSSCPILHYFKKRSRRKGAFPTWITCGGNHDVWPRLLSLERDQATDLVQLAPGLLYTSRGSIHLLDDIPHLFLGGAESTDKHVRIEGKSWWSEETPTYRDFCRFQENLEAFRPQVVVTHEAPLRVPIWKEGRKDFSTPKMLERALSLSSYKPPVWVFGHHHLLDHWKVEETDFYCCGEGAQAYTDTWEQLKWPHS